MFYNKLKVVCVFLGMVIIAACSNGTQSSSKVGITTTTLYSNVTTTTESMITTTIQPPVTEVPVTISEPVVIEEQIIIEEPEVVYEEPEVVYDEPYIAEEPVNNDIDTSNFSSLPSCIAYYESTNGEADSNIFQFTDSTWESYGGEGDPEDASASRQLEVFWLAWDDAGEQHWAAQEGRCF